MTVSTIMLFFPKYINNTPLTSPHSPLKSNALDSPTEDTIFSPISPVLDKFKDCEDDDNEKEFGKKNEPSVFVEMKYKEIENLNGYLETLNTFIKSTYFDYFMEQYGDESIYTDEYNSSDNIKNSLENLESSLLDLLVLPLVKVNNNKKKSEMTNATKEFSNDTNITDDDNENDMEQLVENMKYMGRENDTDIEVDYDEYNNTNINEDDENEEEEDDEQQDGNESEKPKTKEEMKNDLSCNALNILAVFFQYGN